MKIIHLYQISIIFTTLTRDDKSSTVNSRTPMLVPRSGVLAIDDKSSNSSVVNHLNKKSEKNKRDCSYISDESQDNISKDIIIYENILKDIRDMRVLSSHNMNQLNNMSRHKLLYIISLYNMVIRNVNEIL